MGQKLLESYKKRISYIYEDIKLILLSNLDALARDGRMSLKELLDASAHKTRDRFPDPIYLYKNLFILDQRFEQNGTKPEELGLDSRQAILSLIDNSKETIALLYQTAIELKMETSDQFYDLLSSMLERGTKPQDLSKEIEDRVTQLLEAEGPTKAQERLVQTCYKYRIIESVSSQDDAFDTILDLVRAIIKLKTTKLSSCVLQALVLTLFLKDTEKSNQVTELAVEIITTKDDLPKALKRDLFYFVGRKILDLNNLDVRDSNISNKSSSSQIVQSNLLSGGLQ